MRVAFPTNNQKTISNHIGLAKGFLIVDTDSNERFFIENPVLKEIKDNNLNEEGHRGLGTGRIVPILFKKAGVDVFVSREFGEGMMFNLQREGIIPFHTELKNINEALEEIKNSDNKKILNQDDYVSEFGYRRGFGYGRGLGYSRGFRKGFGYGFGRKWI